MKVSKGLGGIGAVTMAEPNMPHPNHHFEMKQMNISKAHDGSFVIKHELGLKKSAMAKPGFDSGYSSRERDSETHTAAGPKELIAHIKKHFGAPAKKKEVMPAASDEDEAGELDEEE